MTAAPDDKASAAGDAGLDEPDKTAIIVPLILGGAILVAVVMIWEAYIRKANQAEMARIEEQVRVELLAAYRDLRAHRPEAVLAVTRETNKKVRKLRRRQESDYLELKVALLLMEGEAMFMTGGPADTAAAEKCFDRAIALMTHASGEIWLFGMLGRGRTRYELGRYREAETDLDHVLERNPNFGAAYYWRSLAREKQGDVDGAAADADRARSLDSWPPLRDFMQRSGDWTRDLLTFPGDLPGPVPDAPVE